MRMKKLFLMEGLLCVFSIGPSKATLPYKDNSKNFDQQFSRYTDYDSSQNLADIEADLIEEITTELVEDIFNKAVVNW